MFGGYQFVVVTMFFYPCLQLSFSLANIRGAAILAMDFVDYIIIRK